MPISVRAAVTRAPGQAFTIESLELNDPLDDDILVRVAAVGLCHTDVKGSEGVLPVPFPIVLGHEGAGIVERVGSRVRRVAPGDHVVLSADYCGTCLQCHRGRMAYCIEHSARNFLEKGPRQIEPFSRDGKRVHGMFFGQSSFATYALVSENSAVKVRKDVPIEKLGPLGCGILTGAGAVFNVLLPEPGTSIAIIGAGSVGLAALLASLLRGCSTIAAVDIFDSKLDYAKRLGSTHGVRSDKHDVTEALRAIQPDGFDFVFDTTGHTKTIEGAVEALAVRGTLGLVTGSRDAQLKLGLQTLFHRGLTIRGIIQGDSVPDTLIPRLVDLFAAGRFPIDELITEYPLSEINTAVDDVHIGKTVKAVLTL